jgi:hypothetical protein
MKQNAPAQSWSDPPFSHLWRTLEEAARNFWALSPQGLVPKFVIATIASRSATLGNLP